MFVQTQICISVGGGGGVIDNEVSSDMHVHMYLHYM